MHVRGRKLLLLEFRPVVPLAEIGYPSFWPRGEGAEGMAEALAAGFCAGVA
jgi:hypothetical protein